MKKILTTSDDIDPLPKLDKMKFREFEEKVKMFDQIKRKRLRKKLIGLKRDLCLQVVKINKQLKILDVLDEKDTIRKKK